MQKLKNIIISFFQIYSQIIFKKRVDVIFYYPQHFNRSKEGTNPYFDPLIEVCNENRIKYVVIEEPTYGTDKPRNIKAIKGDMIFLIAGTIRRLFRVIFNTSYLKREKYAAYITNILTFGKLRVKHCITIGGSGERLFIFLNPKGYTYDLQHGIIYSFHYGYFYNNGLLREELSFNNLRFLVYGKGVKDIFLKKNIKIGNRVLDIGCPIIQEINNFNYLADIILISLQYTDDNNDTKNEYTKLFIDTINKLECYKLNIQYKHHPRFDYSIDLQEECKGYNIKETKERIDNIIKRTKLHITYSSTTAFEFAAYGVPTYFMISEKIPYGKTIFYDEYEYPLYKDMTIEEVIERLNNPIHYEEDSSIVRKWYKKFYKPFDKQAFYNIIKS